MKISSKFRDFYDSGQSFGYDDSIHYIRTKKEIQIDVWPFPPMRQIEFGNILCQYSIVGFCGKLYPLLDLAKHSSFGPSVEKKCFTLQDVDEYMKLVYTPKQWQAYINVDHSEFRKLDVRLHRKRLIDFFEQFDTASSPFFDQYQVPIFTAERIGYGYPVVTTVTLNDILRPREFYRVFDPYTAFQELSMYMSNFAEPRKPIPHIDDVTMAEAKGFNQFSFRKDKSSKKRK